MGGVDRDSSHGTDHRSPSESTLPLSGSVDAGLNASSDPPTLSAPTRSFYNVGYPQPPGGFLSGITPLFQSEGNISFVKSYVKGGLRAELWKTDLDLTSLSSSSFFPPIPPLFLSPPFHFHYHHPFFSFIFFLGGHSGGPIIAFFNHTPAVCAIVSSENPPTGFFFLLFCFL